MAPGLIPRLRNGKEKGAKEGGEKGDILLFAPSLAGREGAGGKRGRGILLIKWNVPFLPVIAFQLHCLCFSSGDFATSAGLLDVVICRTVIGN